MTIHQKLFKYYRKFEQIGITDQLSFSQRLQVELSNIVLAGTIPILILTIVSEIIEGSGIIEHSINIFWALVILPPIIFNYKRKYKLAQYWVVLSGMFFTLLLKYLYGDALIMEPLFVIYILCALYFFNRKEALSIICLMILAYLTLMTFSDFSEAPLRDRSNPSSNFLAFAYTIFMVSLTTFKIIKENKNYRQISFKQQEVLLEKNEQLERFAYVAAHDLKTPLRNLYSYLGLIELKYDKSNDQISEYIDESKKSAHKLHSLVEDILNYSNLDTTINTYEVINLNNIVQEIIKDFSFDIENKGIRILSKNLPVVYGDKLQLKLLLQNVIENGIKYNDSKHPTVEIQSQFKRDKHFISIADNGIGIEEEYRDQIFKMFTRLHNADVYSGTGIGLAVCKKIVEKHNGTIQVESILGEGTTINIILPAQGKTSKREVTRAIETV